MNDVNWFLDGDAFFGRLQHNVPNHGNMNAQPGPMAPQPWNHGIGGYDFDPLAFFNHGPAQPLAPVQAQEQVMNNAQPAAVQLPARPRVPHNRPQYGNFMPAPPHPGQGRVRTPSKARAPEISAEVGNPGQPQVRLSQLQAAYRDNILRLEQAARQAKIAAEKGRIATEQARRAAEQVGRVRQEAMLAGHRAMLAAKEARHAALLEEALWRQAQRSQQ